MSSCSRPSGPRAPPWAPSAAPSHAHALYAGLPIGSSASDQPLPGDLVLFGEVGLAGEVRAVRHADTRLREAAKLGFTRAIVPAATARSVKAPEGLQVTGVASVGELWGELFRARRPRAQSLDT